jgi:hypothetical protein
MKPKFFYLFVLLTSSQLFSQTNSWINSNGPLATLLSLMPEKEANSCCTGLCRKESNIIGQDFIWLTNETTLCPNKCETLPATAATCF